MKVEHYKISKLLNNSTASIFVTNKMSRSEWFIKWSIFCQSLIKTSMLRTYLCDYRDAYIVAKGRLTVEENNVAKTRNKKLIFKNNAPFRLRISIINNTFIGNAEYLDIVLRIYNLLEYRDNYSMTSESLRSYYRDEINDDVNENNAARIKINSNKTMTSKSFEYKQN